MSVTEMEILRTGSMAGVEVGKKEQNQELAGTLMEDPCEGSV